MCRIILISEGYDKYIYRSISNYKVVEKLFISVTTQIVKLVYYINSMHTDLSSLSLWFF